jgi:hypothetical protein
MRVQFDGDTFSFETLRTAGFAAHGGADPGEDTSGTFLAS